MATDMYFKSESLINAIEEAKITNISRPVRPAYERNKVVIPGRDGSYDFGNNRKEDFLIIVELVVIGISAENLQNKLESLSGYLEGKGELYFTDAPTKKYNAQVYDEVSAAGDATARWARVLVAFECDA